MHGRAHAKSASPVLPADLMLPAPLWLYADNLSDRADRRPTLGTCDDRRRWCCGTAEEICSFIVHGGETLGLPG